MTRSFTAVSLAVALSLGGAVVLVGPGASPAQAATRKITVTTPKKVTAPYKKRATVRPKAKSSGNVSIVSTTLTVKKGSKTLVKRKKSAKLKPGSYKTITRVTYRNYTVKTTQSQVRVRVVGVPAYEDVSVSCALTSLTPDVSLPGWYDLTASCTSPRFDGPFRTTGYLVTFDEESDPNASWTGSLDSSLNSLNLVGSQVAVGTTFSDVLSLHGDLYKTVNQTKTTSKKTYGPKKVKSVTRSLVVKAGKKPRTCATYSDFKKVAADFSEPELYGSSMSEVRKLLHSSGKRSQYSDYGTFVIEFRDYKPCTKGADISVGFSDGYAYFKSYNS